MSNLFSISVTRYLRWGRSRRAKQKFVIPIASFNGLVACMTINTRSYYRQSVPIDLSLCDSRLYLSYIHHRTTVLIERRSITRILRGYEVLEQSINHACRMALNYHTSIASSKMKVDRLTTEANGDRVVDIGCKHSDAVRASQIIVNTIMNERNVNV